MLTPAIIRLHRGLAPIGPTAGAGQAADMLRMLSGEETSDEARRALDAYLDWQVVRPSLQDVNVTIELRGPGPSVSSAARNIGEWFHPFIGWQAGDEIGQQLRVFVPADAPPGAYEVWLRAQARRRAWARPGAGPDQTEARAGGQVEIPLEQFTIDPRAP